MLQIIAVDALIVQSYLVTETENEKLNSDKKVFEWLVKILDCSVRGRSWSDTIFSLDEVIRVGSLQPCVAFFLYYLSLMIRN